MERFDIVRGLPGNPYSYTTEKMIEGLVLKVRENSIKVKILKHTEDKTGVFEVEQRFFEVVGKFEFRKINIPEIQEKIKNKEHIDANLQGADLKRANLQGADLQGANLQGANLQDADLQGADLKGAKHKDADHQGADLKSANLQGANLQGADLKRANLQGADLQDADLQGADLKRADLQGADLQGANLQGADLDFSCLPLRCGGLNWKIDKNLACQFAYHLCSMQCDDNEFIKTRNSIIEFANQFHRVGEVKKLSTIKENEEKKNETDIL
jgi:hypothetical protein